MKGRGEEGALNPKPRGKKFKHTFPPHGTSTTPEDFSTSSSLPWRLFFEPSLSLIAHPQQRRLMKWIPHGAGTPVSSV